MIRYMIQDSMHEVFRRLGHLAEITHSKDDAMRELPCLVHLDWNKRLADIFILLNAYHLKSNRKSDWVCVLCDFKTRKTPDGTSPAMQDNTKLRNLQSAEKRKFKGPSLGKNEDACCSVTGYKLCKGYHSALEYGKYDNAICNRSLWTVWTSC